jgi:hypothetical protein
MSDNDFYEDDEPLDAIQAIRRREPDFVTQRPARRGITMYLNPSSATGRWTYSTEPTTLGAAGCR